MELFNSCWNVVICNLVQPIVPSDSGPLWWNGAIVYGNPTEKGHESKEPTIAKKKTKIKEGK